MRQFIFLLVIFGCGLTWTTGISRAGETCAVGAIRNQKLEVAKLRYEATKEAFDMETVDLETFHAAALGWKEASCEIAVTKAERMKALESHRDRIKSLYDKIDALHKDMARGGEEYKYLSTRFWLLEAEIWVLEAKQAGK